MFYVLKSFYFNLKLRRAITQSVQYFYILDWCDELYKVPDQFEGFAKSNIFSI